jgi:magnesium transporter
MAHPLFGPEARILLQDQDAAGMQAFCETLHPATVAEALAEEFSVEEVWRFLNNADIKSQAAVFEYFPIQGQVRMVEGVGRERMAKLIEQMSHDDRGDLVRRLRPRVAEELLRLVDEADRRDIAAVVEYAENTAGALMATDYAWVPETITAGEALDRLRLQAPKSETIYYVYVLDEQRKILGIVTLATLVVALRHARIRDIMTKEVITVRASDHGEAVAQQVARYDLLAIPVVDDENRLIGIVTHDDVLDVVEQEATEDVQRLGGVGVLAENYLEASFLTIWRKRVGWLACLFGAELFTFTALAYFEHAMEKVVVLSLFIPLCISTGGNSGSQAATLITRAMALGHVRVRDWLRVFWHELGMGLALGLSLGAIGFVRASLTPHEMLREQALWWQLALTVAQSVTMICLWGTLIGSMLPLLFRWLGFDPAFASSPFVATFVDVTGIVIYFTAAILWIPSVTF